MKCLLLLSVVAAQAFGVACSVSQHAQAVARRQPLAKHSHEYKIPADYKPRTRGYDPETGDPITYDHKPRLELIDAKAGKYAFKWIGFDGQEKTATFGRPDAVDVVVKASVSKEPSGEYLYAYEVQNLPSSGVFLKRFIVQTFASDVKPEYGGAFLHFSMSKQIRAYSEGNWLMFADVSDHIQIDPGQSVMIRFTSSAPPGLVGCYASAETVVEGTDEEIPRELEILLAKWDETPRGYTVGPDERLAKLQEPERVQYLLDKLPQFRRLGWMTDEAFSDYERRLKSGDLNSVSGRIEQDLKSEQITTEVFAIIEAMG
jgi:hypothetical protein